MSKRSESKASNLSHNEYCVLCCLCDFGNDVCLTELVDHLKILADVQTSGRSLINTLRRMEDENWIMPVLKRKERDSNGFERTGPRNLSAWRIGDAGVAILRERFAWSDRLSHSARDRCGAAIVAQDAPTVQAVAAVQAVGPPAIEADYPKVGPEHSRYGKAGACQSVHHNTQDGCSNPACTQYMEGRHVGA